MPVRRGSIFFVTPTAQLYQAKAASRDRFVVREGQSCRRFQCPHTTHKIAVPAPPRPKTAIKSYR
jgi:hypothetical protein